MRILALVTEAFGGYGGISRLNSDLIQALVESDGSNQIVVLPRIARESILNLPPRVEQLPPEHNEWLYTLRAFQTILQKGPFDFVFCGHLFMVPLAALIEMIFRIPFWIYIYGIDAWEKPSALVAWGVKRAKLVTSISRHTRSRFLQWSDISPDCVRILPCTVDKRFEPGPKPQSLLERYGLAGQKVLLTVSRLDNRSKQNKGHDKVLKVLPAVLMRHPKLIYVIAGEGDDQGRLQALARQLNIEDKVRFIGKVNDRELPDVYRMSDLFVQPSFTEGFGIVFLEAFSCGVPVVGGNQDGTVDALLEGEIGRLVGPDNPEELIRAIEEGLNGRPLDREKVKRFSKQNFFHLVNDLLLCHFERSEKSNGKN